MEAEDEEKSLEEEGYLYAYSYTMPQGAALVASRLIEMQVSSMAFSPHADQGGRAIRKEEASDGQDRKQNVKHEWKKAEEIDREFLSKFAPFSSHALNSYVAEGQADRTWLGQVTKGQDRQSCEQGTDKSPECKESGQRRDKVEAAQHTKAQEEALEHRAGGGADGERKDKELGRSVGDGPVAEHRMKEASVETCSAADIQQQAQGEESRGQGAEMRTEDDRQARRRSSHVPAGRIQRVSSFAGLGIGMALGTVGAMVNNVMRGKAGAAGGLKGAILSEGNSNRLTLALCRMRGAALKLGQLLSIQDEHVIPKDSPLRQVIDRVREEAEQMPADQLLRMMKENLGEDWRSKLSSFDETPIAAASIGQVHRAVTLDGREVAMKIQYPGVADSIDSDISSLNFFLGPIAPRGLFLSTALAELKIAMKAETDYKEEAKHTERMRAFLGEDSEFRVPRVFPNLSTDKILTTELLRGVAIDKCSELPQEERNKIAFRMMKLTLRELFEFNLMQTDPNWSNFLYDREHDVMNLIDFGATQEYPLKFCYQYAILVKASAEKDREKLLQISLEMGFLTGKESPEFLDAHVAAAFITGEPFAAHEYDFATCRMTERNSLHIATMLAGRLTPPPRPCYTLHRKLSGAFLSSIKLGARISCREMFYEYFSRLEKRVLDNRNNYN